MKIVKMKLKQ